MASRSSSQQRLAAWSLIMGAIACSTGREFVSGSDQRQLLPDSDGINDASVPGADSSIGTEDESGGDTPSMQLCDGGVPSSCLACPGCLIDGVCRADESTNPNNFCQICDLGRDTERWSNRQGGECDDQLFCTTGDTCAEGSCVGVARTCEDGVACNGISVCDELVDACTPGSPQCDQGELCDATSNRCVSTCDGCIIDGTCIADGVVNPANPCLVCDPARSAGSYSVAPGRPCGAEASVCSGQDTCDELGVCQPNHAPSGTPCGSAVSNACNQPDTCNGNGFCEQRLASNASPCNDGQFCSVGDECQGGSCVANAFRSCGVGRTCDENADQCRCLGCEISGSCLVAGTVSSANPCQVCDPGRSSTSFSPVVCAAGRLCDQTGRCACPAGQTEVNGNCGILDGQPCASAPLCFSGSCTEQFRDRDNDGFGDSATRVAVCGPLQSGFANRGGDCCDNAADLAAAARVSPSQTGFFADPSPVCSVGYDYNCDGVQELRYPALGDCSGDTDVVACRRTEGFDVFPPPSCGTEGVLTRCDFISTCSAFARGLDVQTCR